jgi:tetratricopeptide (TPR) repeat protein
MLGAARGRAANQKLLRCDRERPQNRVHVLVTTVDGSRGWSVPARFELGLPRALDDSGRAALEAATLIVERATNHEVHRHVRLLAEEHGRIDGSSLGLPVALAYAAWLCDRPPSVPVFATGRLLEDGVVGVVDHLPAKIDAARADLGDLDGLILVPSIPNGVTDARVKVVRSWAEAATAVFGTDQLRVHPRVAGVVGWLVGLAGVHSDEALRRLDGVDEASLRPRDRVLYLVHRGNHLRHVGRTLEARDAHAQAREVARGARLDPQQAQELELEQRNTLLDFYELDEPIAWLRERIAEDSFATRELELRYRGTLSRALAMAGRFDEALATRTALLPLHDEDEALARQLPRSLNELVLVAGLARDERAFEDALERLARATVADLWSTSAVVRAHVLLRRDPPIVAWCDGVALPCALRFSDLFGVSSEDRGRHPRASTLRSVVRALRRSGRLEDAVRVAGSIRTPSEGLEAWVAQTVHLEEALTLHAAGRIEEADRVLDRARAALRSSSPQASRRHHRLIEGTWVELEAELDAVFY